jgi:hypothetical protein
LPRSSYELHLYNSKKQQIGKTLINLLWVTKTKMAEDQSKVF